MDIKVDKLYLSSSVISYVIALKNSVFVCVCVRVCACV